VKKHLPIAFEKKQLFFFGFSSYIINKGYIHNNEKEKKGVKDNHKNGGGMLKKIKKANSYKCR